MLLKKKDVDFPRKNAIKLYCEVQKRNKEVIRPEFVSFLDNILFLKNQRITSGYAAAIGVYLG